jgi:hypothetical protein
VTGRFDHGTAPDPAQEARAADTLAEIAMLSPVPPHPAALRGRRAEP